MAKFSEAFALTMSEEGGYANNKTDYGGETYKGISRRANPNWSGWKTVDRVTTQTNDVDRINALLAREATVQDAVRALYKANYWDVNRLDAFANQAVANELFDTGVNAGTGTAARFLQEALGLLTGTKVPVDGVVGPQTLAMANGYAKQPLLLKMLNSLQAEHYLKIIRRDTSQRVFAGTWLGRVFGLGKPA